MQPVQQRGSYGELVSHCDDGTLLVTEGNGPSIRCANFSGVPLACDFVCQLSADSRADSGGGGEARGDSKMDTAREERINECTSITDQAITWSSIVCRGIAKCAVSHR